MRRPPVLTTLIQVHRTGPNTLAFPPEHHWFKAGQRLLRDDKVLGEIIELRVGPGGQTALTVVWDEPERRDPTGHYYYERPQPG